MTYTNSQATAGRGSTLSIGTTPTPIGEIRSASPTGNKWGTADVTNFESGINEEFITTIRNNGEVKISGNRVSADAGQVLVEAAFNSGVIQQFLLTLPKSPSQTTTGDTYSFFALVESREFKVEVNSAISWEVSLKCSGAVTSTTGS
jgi:hypothetical protein